MMTLLHAAAATSGILARVSRVTSHCPPPTRAILGRLLFPFPCRQFNANTYRQTRYTRTYTHGASRINVSVVPGTQRWKARARERSLSLSLSLRPYLSSSSLSLPLTRSFSRHLVRTPVRFGGTQHQEAARNASSRDPVRIQARRDKQLS